MIKGEPVYINGDGEGALNPQGSAEVVSSTP